ncbi:MAG: iron-sulfur cluster assembly accessory protein [Gammaproteobacteria bacterium]|nr:iron-sulfur cluster assembly accessory protein [Gammaproteobacteria bacterium]MCB1925434.1 iron-sulfur cluster assembly accessory protein [Gammaproteobacteria bacterium]
MTQVALADHELTLTGPAQGKMAELMAQVEDNVQGVRVFATPGGCSGVSFGMTFTDQLNDDDRIREYEGIRVIVDTGTLEYIRGVEIDFVDGGDGDARFVFNNLQPVGGGGCGTCGSQGGCS